MNLVRTIGRPLSLIVVVLSLATMATGQTFTVLKSFSPQANATGLSPQAPLVQGPDDTLYGVASGGGANAFGVVFKIQPDGTGFIVLRSFSGGSDGANPCAGLLLSGSTLYGTTETGGSSGNGTVFQINTDGSGFTVLKGFPSIAPDIGTNSDGANPYGALALSGGTLYGTTYNGGNWGWGGVFAVNTNGSGFTNLYSFNGEGDGGNPAAGLALSGSTLYGTTENGGSWGWGTVFEINSDGSGFTNVYSFAFNDGAFPQAGLVLSGETLYGTTENGGSSGWGTVFKVNKDGSGFTTIKSFTGGSDGANPYAGLVVSGSTLYGTTEQGGGTAPDVSGDGTVFAVNTDGSGFTVLENFTSGNVEMYPYAGLLLSGDALYGTTFLGGSWGTGTIFKVNIDRSGFAVIENFAAASGAISPQGGLALLADTLFGTLGGGGTSGNGAVYGLNTDGSGFTIFKYFSPLESDAHTNGDGAFPQGNLLLSGGEIYGITSSGGTFGYGTLFMINADGNDFSNLYSFNSPIYPNGGLALTGSTLFGSGAYGGSSGDGTMFEINTNGSAFNVFETFSGTSDGANPSGQLLLANSILYGTTYSGGSSGNGTIFKVNTDGNSFSILKNFSAIASSAETNSDGANPNAGLVLSGSTLYGTTFKGGTWGFGTIFKISTDGSDFTNIYSFTNLTWPNGGLALLGASLLGTSAYGGAAGKGSVFKINTNGGNFTVLKSFLVTNPGSTTNTDGIYPATGLVLSGGMLYGATLLGGIGSGGTVFELNLSIPLNVTFQTGQVILSWSDPTFVLEASSTLTGVYTNIIGASSPHTNSITGAAQFFRLQEN